MFAQAFIPRRLEEVEDHETDHQRLQASQASSGRSVRPPFGMAPSHKLAAQGGECEGIYYQIIAGMASDMSGARLQPRICEQLQHGKGVPEAAIGGGSDDEVSLTAFLLRLSASPGYC